MKLTKNNLTEWKNELNIQAKDIMGDNYADCLSDEEWLELYEGLTPQEAIEEDLWACM